MAAISHTLSAQIDLHSHAVTENYLTFIKEHHAEMDEGFPIPHWDVSSHLAFMDRAGIETSVLTMPAPQPWFGDGAASAAAYQSHIQTPHFKKYKEGTAKMVRSLKLIDVNPLVPLTTK